MFGRNPVFLFLMLLTACSSSAADDSSSGANTTAEGGQVACSSTESPMFRQNPEPLPNGAGQAALSDAQILAVVRIANDGEIAAGRLAVARGVNADVKGFAQKMIDDHTAANQRLQTLAQTLNAQCAPSPVATNLLEDASIISATLATLNGETFDRVYMDSQVAAHAKVAFLGDALLYPSAARPELRSELQALRASVQHHLQEAAAMQDMTFKAP